MLTQAKLQHFAPGDGVKHGAHKPDFVAKDWYDIAVPGDVHQTLIDAGVIEDPFYDRNEEKCAWMEGQEWWYRLALPAPAAPPPAETRLELIFHGLDTFATIWLNGEVLGSHSSMFYPARFDVTQLLQYDAVNSIAICFHPPLEMVKGKELDEAWGRNLERIFMRKAQFGYGWDWGPRLPTIGLWRPVELRRITGAAIQGIHFATVEIRPDDDLALVSVTVEATRVAVGGDLAAAVTLRSPDGDVAAAATVPLQPASGEDQQVDAGGMVYLQVANPSLWWTHDLGEPALYELEVQLLHDGAEVDDRLRRVGIRTIELDQSVDTAEPGTRFFRFLLNGVSIFAKGGNWIPAHSFVGAIPAERYAMLLAAAKHANMNMVRIWGGGIYEHDVFYDLCDELGILIWQDFMFSCAPYPEEPDEFVADVAAEVEYQVRRLRSHPSMALWCGNNENQWLHDMIHWDNPVTPVPGELYYNQIIPAAIQRLDDHIPYWPSSPYGGNDFNSQEDGDVHNWNTWHGNWFREFGEEPKRTNTPAGVSYRRYAEDMGRFSSEFGMHAAPVFETLRRNIPADQLYHHSPSMDHHNKDTPKNKGDNLMEAITGLPKNLEEYIDFSMIAQAEGLKFGIEHYRRRKPHCSGTIIWQLNDCWPVLSWSVMDYYGFGKAGYYYTTRVYAPILASFKEEDQGVSLWITNDTLAAFQETATVYLCSFAGKVLWREAIKVNVPANGSICIWRSGSRLEEGPDRYLGVKSGGGSFATNRHFFGDIKDQRFSAAAVTMEAEQVDPNTVHVTLQSDYYAYFVHLIVPDEATRFSDNYIDLEAGTPRTLVVTNPDRGLRPQEITLRWRNPA